MRSSSDDVSCASLSTSYRMIPSLSLLSTFLLLSCSVSLLLISVIILHMSYFTHGLSHYCVVIELQSSLYKRRYIHLYSLRLIVYLFPLYSLLTQESTQTLLSALSLYCRLIGLC